LIHNSHALTVRRQMLHAWASRWYQRHERQLASEGVRFPLRVGHSTFSVTSEQALAAVSRTAQELDCRLADHPTWGCDRHGRPSDLAMRGLINRRLSSRLVDQLRLSAGVATESLARPIPGVPDGDLVLGDTIAGPSSVQQAEARIWLGQILALEPQATREVVVRRLFGEPAHAISLELGLEDAATRQRISRFKRRHSADLLDAA
jgi:hypothetical protein